MKRLFANAFLLTSLLGLSACSLFGGVTKTSDSGVTYDKELDKSTGKWCLLDSNKQATETFFEFNGESGNMTFRYFENGAEKYHGSYRVVYHENTGENASTLTWCLKRNDVEKEDYVYAYADDFETNFTQFTTIKEERDEGMNDGRIYAHIYRISELPYKLGTYILNGSEYKQEKDNYCYANRYQIPEGDYLLSRSTGFTFIMPKPYSYALFRYINGVKEVVEGVYWTSEDKKTIYLYIDHDPYQYIRREDRDKYDMTYSHDYPPDFYLRGDFDASNSQIRIDSLYHHDYSQTTVLDSVWKFGTYIKY